MNIKHEIQIYKIIKYLNNQRKKQIILLLLLLLLSGFLEAFSIASAVPFLSLLSEPNTYFSLPIIEKISIFLNIEDASQLFLLTTVLFCILIILSTSIRLLNLWFILSISGKINRDLSTIIFKKNLYQSYTEYTNRSSSEIISLITDKCANTTIAISSLLKVIAAGIISLSIIISLAIVNFKITFYIIFIVFIYYYFITKNVKNILTNNSSTIAKLEIKNIKLVQESIGGFRDIVINNTQNFYQNIFKQIQLKLHDTKASSNFLVSYPRLIIEGSTIIIIVLFGFYLSKSSNDLTYLTILGTYAYGGQKLLPIIQQIYAGWALYKLKSSDLTYTLDELSRKSNEIRQDQKIINYKDNFNTFELKKVYFSYVLNSNSKYVLEDVSLKISNGDFIGIYGKTGCGKSTLLDILMGLIKPYKGEILIDNHNLYKDNKLYKWRRQFSHVPQNIFLKEGTIRENIIFGEKNYKFNYELLLKASKIAHIDEFINQIPNGFNTYVGERGIRLSGGQKQRIAIARAIYRGKKILILDEATSALDSKTEKSIIESIKNLDNNMTTIMVTHRESTLLNCNKVFRIDNGRLIN